MSRSAHLISHHELDRIAIAVDALTFGSPRPLLVHVSRTVANSQPDHRESSVLGIEPWEPAELDRLEQPEAFAPAAPQAWSVLGIASPVSVATHRIDANDATWDGWLVHLVNRRGQCATRIWSSRDQLAMQTLDVTGGRIDQYCRRRLGLPYKETLEASH